MINLNRALSIVFVLGLLVMPFSGYGFQASRAGKSDIKDIVGKWSGTATQEGDSEVMQVTIEFRLDGSRIVGEVHSAAAELKVTNVSFASSKWAITCVSPDGVEAKITCSLNGAKLLGEWAFGESTGKFELSKSEG